MTHVFIGQSNMMENHVPTWALVEARRALHLNYMTKTDSPLNTDLEALFLS